MIDSFIHSLIGRQRARKGRDYAWHDALIIASLGCWSDFCDRLDEWEHRDGVREREKVVSYITDDATWVRHTRADSLSLIQLVFRVNECVKEL